MMVDIKGFEGQYAVTEDGQIWSYKSKKFLQPFDNGHGYLYVPLYNSITKERKKKRINRLVAEAYLPQPEGANIIAHIDDDRKNNHVSNLCWTTQKENLDTDNFREKSKKRWFTKVKCVETGDIYPSQAAAARAVGIHKYGINNVLMGKQQTAGGYHWERVVENE